MKIVWLLIWYCITPGSLECMKTDLEVRDWNYISEEQCHQAGEHHGEYIMNEKKFKVEFACVPHEKPWIHYVPTRRYDVKAMPAGAKRRKVW